MAGRGVGWTPMIFELATNNTGHDALLIIFHDNNQVLIRTVAMAAQLLNNLYAFLDFPKIVSSANLQQNVLKLPANRKTIFISLYSRKKSNRTSCVKENRTELCILYYKTF